VRPVTRFGHFDFPRRGRRPGDRRRRSVATSDKPQLGHRGRDLRVHRDVTRGSAKDGPRTRASRKIAEWLETARARSREEPRRPASAQGLENPRRLIHLQFVTCATPGFVPGGRGAPRAVATREERPVRKAHRRRHRRPPRLRGAGARRVPAPRSLRMKKAPSESRSATLITIVFENTDTMRLPGCSERWRGRRGACSPTTPSPAEVATYKRARSGPGRALVHVLHRAHPPTSCCVSGCRKLRDVEFHVRFRPGPESDASDVSRVVGIPRATRNV